MQRRNFITLLGGAAATSATGCARAATGHAGDRSLNGGSPDTFAPTVSAFLQGLKEAGYVDGQNVAIEIAGRTANTIV